MDRIKCYYDSVEQLKTQRRHLLNKKKSSGKKPPNSTTVKGAFPIFIKIVLFCTFLDKTMCYYVIGIFLQHSNEQTYNPKKEKTWPRLLRLFFFVHRFKGGDLVANKKIMRGSASMLAELLGISERRVFQLVDEKVVKKERSGEFKLPSAIADYYNFKLQPKSTAPTGTANYQEERALKERINRQLIEIELAKKRNSVHNATDVELVMTNMLTNLRTQLLGLPAKLAPILANNTKEQIAKILTQEVEQALTELSDYDPEMFGGENEEEQEKE